MKAIREERGISGAALARRLHISESQVNRLENGDRKLTLEWILRLCSALETTADELVDIPVKGINKAKCDPVLLDSVIGFLLDACAHYRVKQASKDIAKWTTYIYNDAVEQHLTHKQACGLAYTLVKASKRG
jgi:transcriptional regulator with XRE-family HTH domain